MLQLTARRFN